MYKLSIIAWRKKNFVDFILKCQHKYSKHWTLFLLSSSSRIVNESTLFFVYRRLAPHNSMAKFPFFHIWYIDTLECQLQNVSVDRLDCFFFVLHFSLLLSVSLAWRYAILFVGMCLLSISLNICVTRRIHMSIMKSDIPWSYHSFRFLTTISISC